MTDWQQPLIVALTQAEGVSVVHETVYENRFGFTDALIEMGADIVVHKDGLESVTRRVPRRQLEQAAVITGPTPLHGADVRVPDLRGGFSYLIAALTAEGASTVTNVGIISRGYEHFVDKLEALGAPTSPRGLSALVADADPTRDRPSSAARRRPSGVSSAALVIPFVLLVGRYRVHARRAHPARAAPFVMAANHISDIDPLVTAYTLWHHGRVPHYLAKACLFRVPVRGLGVPRHRAGAGRARGRAARATRSRRASG